MFQTRFHGRGGQGVVTAAEMLSVAAFLESKHAQAFPSFGSERMGAPVVSFCRIDGTEIRLRDPIYDPDAMIIQDPTLIATPGLFDGLKADGYVLLNSSHALEELSLPSIVRSLPKGHLITIPATEIALKHIKRPLPNAVMLGGFSALTGVVALESVIKAIEEAFSGAIGSMNVAAATEAYQFVKSLKDESHKEKELVSC